MEHLSALRCSKVFHCVPLCSIMFHQESAKTALAGQNHGFRPVEHPPPVKVFHCVPFRGCAGIIPWFGALGSPARTCGAKSRFGIEPAARTPLPQSPQASCTRGVALLLPRLGPAANIVDLPNSPVCNNGRWCVVDGFEQKMRRGGEAAVREAGRFFMKDDPVHQTLRTITACLDSLGIAYAVAGGMALVAHGYDRTTVDIDVLLTADGYGRLKKAVEGLGYLPPFKSSKNLRDSQTGATIKFLITCQYPGDGKPKPVAFPDPARAAVEIGGIRYVSLPALIELKLASGMTAPGRLKDLADVQELIRALKLPRDTANQLNSYVQQKFLELWDAVHGGPEPS